jgi:hypothetical protein
MDGDDNKFGRLTDLFVGGKATFVGEEGILLDSSEMRLALGLGIKAALPRTENSTREEDLHLWGSAGRLYYDYIFDPLFYLNTYIEVVYYPDQKGDGPNYLYGGRTETRTVSHPLELTFEMEGHFRYQVENSGIVLQAGIPLRYNMAPWIDREGDDKAKESQYRFSAGAFFMVSFTGIEFPLDLGLRYLAPLAGKNDQMIHRITLFGRINIDTVPLK